MQRIKVYGPSLVLAVVTLAVLLGGPQVIRQLAWAQQDAAIERSRQALRNSPLDALNAAFRDVASAVEPSVVHLSVSRRRAEGLRLPPGLPDELEDFFRRYRDRQREGQEEPSDEYEQYDVPQRYGNGSGWVYEHANGNKYIVTNNHVVDEADRIVAKFFDKTERVATLVGADPQTDIAVLRVDNGSLHAAELADRTVDQGEIVFAFGSPFEFEFSVSQGIVSGKGRQLGILRSVQGYENFIQTDAAINPGNSGGPLTNIHGQVVGMNTAIASRTGGFMGIGFAIPTHMIRDVADQIIEKGQVSRGFLGITLGPELDRTTARTFGYEGEGVLVDDVLDGYPADRAGVQPGDIITQVDGRPVTNTRDLRGLIASLPPGREVRLTVARDEDNDPETPAVTRELTVKLAELEPEAIARAGEGRGGFGEDNGPISEQKLEPLRRLGFERLRTMTERLAEAQEGVEFVPGVLVESVRRGSVAYTEGLRSGVIITAVQGRPVKTVADLAERIADYDLTEGVRFRVRLYDSRGNTRNTFIVLKLPTP